VPDRPTLSATGHGSRPDSGDPTDRLSHAVSPPPGWVRTADRPTLSEAARGREVYFQLRFAKLLEWEVFTTDRVPLSVAGLRHKPSRVFWAIFTSWLL